jgi:hypothetical protein
MRINTIRGASIHKEPTTGDVVCEVEKIAGDDRI